MTTAPIPDAAVDAACDAAALGSSWEETMRICLAAALPHLLPRALMIEAAQTIMSEWETRNPDGNYGTRLAKRLRDAAAGDASSEVRP